MSKPLKAFITHSHEDKQKKKKLRTCLAVMERDSKLELQDDDDITAGGKASQEDILKEVAASDILLYLVSADSLASKNCNKELTEAVSAERRVIPIILESCDWLGDQLRNFEVLPDKGKPINKWKPQSDGWQNVVDGVREVVEEMQSQADLPSRTTNDERRAKSALQQGNVLMMIGQISKAIEAYSHAIELKSGYAHAYNNRGISYRENGEYNRAIRDCSMALELDKDDFKAYNNRGNAYVDKGDNDRAIDDFNMAVRLQPDRAESYSNRGNAYSAKGEHERAIKDYDKAIALNPTLTESYSNRGAAYAGKGEYDRAIEDYNKAIELNPNSAEAYSNRGAAFVRKGEHDRAIEDYDKAIGLKPDLAEAYTNRGNAFSAKGEIDRAIIEHDRAIELNFAEAYYNCGVVWLQRGEFEKARADLIAGKKKGVNIATLFREDYESTEDFEARNGVSLPQDIAAMLTPHAA